MNKRTKLPEKGSKEYDALKAHLYSKKKILGEDSPFSEILQNLVNEMLEGEIESFLKTDQNTSNPNKRNGKIPKKVMSEAGPLYIETPRDRKGAFEPSLIEKRQRTLSSGLDEQIIALYAQGNSIEDVRRLLLQIYGVEISSGKISQITDKILPVIRDWQDRSLQRFYPIVYLDAIHFKIRHEGKYSTRAFYTVYSVDWEGHRDLLGLYVQDSEGASKWSVVLQDLVRRGVEDILVICTDNLKGFSEAIMHVFPSSIVQKCIVHQVRNSLQYVDDKDRKTIVKELRKIYTAPTREQAEMSMDAFEVKWSTKYSYIIKQWRTNWEELIAFMSFSPDMRRMIYTTNPVEALHRIIRKITKGKAAWVSETALMKQIYLSLMQNEKSWKRKAHGWKSIQRDLLEKYGNRVQA